MGKAKINIKGAIVSDEDKWIYDWLGIAAVSPKDVTDVIDSLNGEELEVDINSGGGEVFAGIEIYTAIRSYRGRVCINCVGLAGSAASVILMAGHNKISPSGMVMIHNVATGARGDYHAMDSTSEVLQQANKAICSAYVEKTKMSQEDLLALMDKTTWLTADEAIEQGFVDEIMESKNNNITLYNSSQILDKGTINKIRNNLLNNNDFNKEGSKLGNDITNVEQLKATYPGLVAEIVEAARLEATTSERERIKAIDEISGNLTTDLVNDAKYVNAVSASELALNALKANKEIGANVFKNMVEGIVNSGAQEIQADANVGYADDGEQKANKIRSLADKFKAALN